jgi:hypothetical protein
MDLKKFKFMFGYCGEKHGYAENGIPMYNMGGHDMPLRLKIKMIDYKLSDNDNCFPLNNF